MSKRRDYIKEILENLSDSRRFNNETKIKDFDSYKKTPYNTWPESWKKVHFKAYPRLGQVILPEPSEIEVDLQECLTKRSSWRNFSNDAIEIQRFSNLLYYSAGLKRLLDNSKGERRFYPSAGARYPLEICPFVFKVDGLKSAVYHYHLKTHSLEVLLNKPIFRQTMKQFSQPWIRKSAVLFVITALFGRTEGKYGDRGYRHILTEYGHIAQNFYLVSAGLNLGCCSIGGFVDDGLNKMIDIDGIDESVIGVVAIGNKDKKK